MSENPYQASRKERIKKAPVVLAAVAAVALAGAANKASGDDDNTRHGESVGNHHRVDIPVKSLDKDSTITIKVRKDETASDIAHELMAEPEDFTKIEDQIKSSQEYPSVLAEGTVEHLPADEIDKQALAQRRGE